MVKWTAGEDILKYLEGRGSRITHPNLALQKAVRHGKDDLVTHLIDKCGADVEARRGGCLPVCHHKRFSRQKLASGRQQFVTKMIFLSIFLRNVTKICH
jgi:hypothetical protein